MAGFRVEAIRPAERKCAKMIRRQSRAAACLSQYTFTPFATFLTAGASSTDPEQIATYTTDQRQLFTGSTFSVLKPAATKQVADIARLAARLGVGLVPQGGKTGFCGDARRFRTAGHREHQADGHPPRLLHSHEGSYPRSAVSIRGRALLARCGSGQSLVLVQPSGPDPWAEGERVTSLFDASGHAAIPRCPTCRAGPQAPGVESVSRGLLRRKNIAGAIDIAPPALNCRAVWFNAGRTACHPRCQPVQAVARFSPLAKPTACCSVSTLGSAPPARVSAGLRPTPPTSANGRSKAVFTRCPTV